MTRLLGTGTSWTLGRDLQPSFYWRGFRFNSADELGSIDAGDAIPRGSHDSSAGMPLPTCAVRDQQWMTTAG